MLPNGQLDREDLKKFRFETNAMKWLFLLVGGLAAIFLVAALILAGLGGLDNVGVSEATIVIDAPAKDVFEWTTEPSYTPRWVRRLKTSTKISQGVLKPDAIVREVITTPKGNYELTGTFSTYEPEKRAVVEYVITGWKKKGEKKLIPKKKGDEPVLTVRSEIELDPRSETSTTLTYRAETTYGPWYMRLMEPMATYSGRLSMESNLFDLKERLEADYQREREREQKAAAKKAEREKKKKKIEAKKSVRDPSQNKNLREMIPKPRFRPSEATEEKETP